MKYINSALEIANHVNQLDDLHLNLRLKELEEYAEQDSLSAEELIELNFICLKILTFVER